MAKRKATTRKTEIKINFYDIDERCDDRRDTDEFKQFEDLIESVLSATPQTIREIRLNAETSNFNWLGDALDSLVVKGRARLISGYLDKYVVNDGDVQTVRKMSKHDYSYNFLSV